jgi:hypothetical protein
MENLPNIDIRSINSRISQEFMTTRMFSILTRTEDSRWNFVISENSSLSLLSDEQFED